jgi:ElaB/YqjD/DUF883 family membrane-anchored ribosome-binding protein
MIGALARYAANRAVHNVADNMVRRVTWSAIAAVLGLIGVIFALIVGFWLLEEQVGEIWAGVIIAGACFAAAAIAMAVPSMMERAEKPADQASNAMAETVQAVKQEAQEAVDYIGPIRLVGSAFAVGLGMGRRVNSRGAR